MGTGLGLPLAKELVELHGGTLSLESAPGRGTTVTIRLPGRVATRAAAAEAPAVLDRSRARA
jgi:signal transduction histidine kinase